MNEEELRRQLRRLLEWEDAHVGFDRAVSDLPQELRGARPFGLPYSPWQLLEHLRRTQRDILEFCRNPGYVELAWPDDYWPPAPDPPVPEAWDQSIRRFREDRTALQEIAADRSVALDAPVPHGDGQSRLRELVLAADHTAYHVGQLVIVRRLLGAWPPE